MAEGREAAGLQARAPLRRRSRRRWAIAGGVGAGWVVLEIMTGSAVSATVVLVTIATLGVASVSGLRILGITGDHPWMRRLASRPWRDGQDVLNVAMRHLSEVFVVTPSGSLLAPSVVELQLNPDDLGALCERMELGVISASMTEVYEEQVAAHRAHLARPGWASVYISANGAVPPGRYRLRQGDPVRDGAQPDRSGVQYAEAGPGARLRPSAAGLRRARQQRLAGLRYGRRRRDDHDDGTDARLRSCTATGHRIFGGGNPDVRRSRRARVGRVDAPRRAHGIQGAREVHVLRRSLVDREPGPERTHPQRRARDGRAVAQRRRCDPLGGQA